MPTDAELIAQKISDLEQAISRERVERKEALLWQEHRVVSAAKNFYDVRRDPDLRWAAAGGLFSAFMHRMGTSAAVGGGLITAGVAALLAFQANQLLAIQNEKMDVQTVVMDAQRRSQNFQSEFSAIATAVETAVAKRASEEGLLDQEYNRVVDAAKISIQSMLKDAAFSSARDELAKALASLEKNTRQTVGKSSLRDAHYYLNQAGHKYNTWQTANAVNSLVSQIQPTQENYDREMNSSESPSGRRLYRLEGVLLSRIAGLSRDVKPYPTLNIEESNTALGAPDSFRALLRRLLLNGMAVTPKMNASLSAQKTSPERGQLLTFLLGQAIEVEGVSQTGADFRFADMSFRVLKDIAFDMEAQLAQANFYKATLRDVTLNGDFSGAIFRCARFQDTSFGAIKLNGADFTGAVFVFRDDDKGVDWSVLTQADFTYAEFDQLTIIGVDDVVDKQVAHELSGLLKRFFPDRSARISSMYEGWGMSLEWEEKWERWLLKKGNSERPPRSMPSECARLPNPNSR